MIKLIPVIDIPRREIADVHNLFTLLTHIPGIAEPEYSRNSNSSMDELESLVYQLLPANDLPPLTCTSIGVDKEKD